MESLYEEVLYEVPFQFQDFLKFLDSSKAPPLRPWRPKVLQASEWRLHKVLGLKALLG
ncbi:hypothetical protein M758_9G075300 [Ceratodon purpureus]|nr:hypothetical protein M758_9G075300 [Ceratodon purpureus]